MTPFPVLCSTARLARSLRLEYGRGQLARGETRWQPLQALTLAQWLDGVLDEAMLRGEFPADSVPSLVLGSLQERILWERVIDTCLDGAEADALFSREGLADAALEANRLLLEWHVPLPHGEQTEETRQFLRWREVFRNTCDKSHWMDAARHFDWQIARIAARGGRVPERLYIAGFDRICPQEQKLFDALAARGVELHLWQAGLDSPAQAMQVACDDAEAECRAAVAWVKAKLTENPRSRLAIVAPELGTLHQRLTAILDDTLHPASIHPSLAEIPRCYDFSLGEPLAGHPLISSALALLRLAVRRYPIAQQDAGWLLRDIHWSAGIHEADARARLEARMRRKLGSTLHFDQLLRLVRKAQLEGGGLARLVQHLEALGLESAAWPKKQYAPAWAAAFGSLLKTAGWPGERSLSSHEFQARQAWVEVLTDFASLENLLGLMDAPEALRRLAAMARDRIFQPEAEGEPQLLVMGMLEAAAAPLDAIWVMGMNDHAWPPPARPNPLLPASLQRAANAPNACARVQAEFAQVIHQRLLYSAPEVVFSWSHKDGERELRPSPLLEAIAVGTAVLAPAATMAEQLAVPVDMQWLKDHQAPPVTEGEEVRGGTGLLRAQAICPAWGYYQYRLGARALDEPVEGLDAMDRGILLHAVLQCFWDGRNSVDLQGMDTDSLYAAVAIAVEAGIRLFAGAREEQLPQQFAALEKQRLQRLVMSWLEYEKARDPFAVLECERRVSLQVEGLQVNLVLDRVDALPDGRLVVLDYKTGANVSHKSWAEDRITEPQLPIYAALALSGEQVAAVCFAKVRPNEQKFIGIADATDLLPDVKGLEDVRKLFPENRFPDWAALIHHWQTSVQTIALEIRDGEAAIRFDSEDALRDCEVMPLLRLPERKLQMERGGGHGC
jgi:exodeoxyribonuclease-5